MSEKPYVLLDRKTRNFLGWFDTLDEAEKAFFDFVRPHPPAAEHLEIWREDERVEVDPEKIRRLTAA
jgi:hypothetical protein